MILALLLVVVVASAQVPGYNNGGLRHELRSWWNGVWGIQSSFHYGNSFYDNKYQDGASGVSFGFVGGYEGQYLRRDTRKRGNDYGSQWDMPFPGGNSDLQRYVSASQRQYKQNSSSSAIQAPLNRKVWQKQSRAVTYINLSSSSTVGYGRRVRPVKAPVGNYNTISVALPVSIAREQLKDTKDPLTEDVSDRLTGNTAADNSGGGFGFGEVPHDDADMPIGDGLLLMTLLATVWAIKKRVSNI